MQHTRTFFFGQRDDNQRTVEASLSSEQPVFRPGLGNEILLHTPDAVDLTRAPLPIICSHDAFDMPVGVVEGLRIIGRKLRGTLRFGTSQRASDLWADVQAGVIRNLSIGYQITDYVQEGETFRVTRWQPYELSLVAVPADATVGIGRAFLKETEMNTQANTETTEANETTTRSQRRAETRDGAAERQRVEEILLIGEDHAELDGIRLASKAVRDGTSVADYQKILLAAKRSGTDQVLHWGAPGHQRSQSRDEHSAGNRVIQHGVTARFADVFGEMHRQQEFETFGDFARAVYQGDTKRLSRAASGMSSGSGSDGGYYVPPEFTAGLLDAALEDEVIRPRAHVYPMASKTLEAPVFDYSNHSTGVAGFVGAWMAEGSEANIQKAKVRSIGLTARKLAIFTSVTSELLFDGGPAFERDLHVAMTAALGFYFDSAFIGGTGAGQPLGIMNDRALVSVAKETSQLAGTIVGANIAKMYGRLSPSSVKNATWLVHPSAIPQLLTLGIVYVTATGTAVTAAGAPLVRNAAGEMRLYDRPVVITEHCQPVGTKGDIMLVDLTQYLVGLRQDLYLERSIETGWRTDEVHFRMIARADGQGAWSAPITPKNGSDTLSWVVSLDARA